MEDAIHSGGTSVPPAASGEAPDAGPRTPSPLERLASFRFTYLAFCAFVLLDVTTVRIVEDVLTKYFAESIQAAAEEGARDPDPARGIGQRVEALLRESRWIRLGGVRVHPVIASSSGRSVIYAPGLAGPAGDGSPWSAYRDTLLPPRILVVVSVPHNALVANAVLVFYAALLLTLLYAYTRILTRREQEQVALIASTRDALAQRAALIETELGAVRERLAEVEPAQESDEAEIRELRTQRSALLEEHNALESLLEEALTDIGRKDEELRALQKQAKQRTPARREDEQLERRLRTLYKNLEIDDRAIADLVGLRDETLKLRAEEMLKRLSDDADHTAVRRKVGGLPPHLSIFELGFAGGGRIYYTKGRVRRHRVLSLGDKASQKRDLEYLSRLPKE
jgi:hypothetical protein